MEEWCAEGVERFWAIKLDYVRRLASSFQSLIAMHILRPTPGFGEETLMNSYDPASVEDHLTIRGNGFGCVTTFLAMGLHALMFIILNTLHSSSSFVQASIVPTNMVFLQHHTMPCAFLRATPAGSARRGK